MKHLLLAGLLAFPAIPILAASYQMEAPVTVSLTLSYSQESERTVGAKTTYTSTVKTVKVLNKDIINRAKEDGLIDTTIGWQLISITPPEAEYPSVVLRKAKNEDIYLDLFTWEPLGWTDSYTSVYDNDKETTISETAKWTELGTLFFTGGGLEAELNGKLTGGWALKKMGSDMVFLESATSINLRGTGSLDTIDLGDGSALVEGTITVAARKAIKIEDDFE